MADLNFYQLSMTGSQVNNVLNGAVIANGAQNLTEEEKAQARKNIGATAAGNGIRIIAHYNTLSGLNKYVENPKPGDAYSVGTATPYTLYIYDALQNGWVNYGPIQSIDISAMYVKDVTVPVSAWTNDSSIFTDYPYKASISIAGVSETYFPIVCFWPSYATVGNFCPVAYTFDGYVQIFAKNIPSAEMTIAAITFIVYS